MFGYPRGRIAVLRNAVVVAGLIMMTTACSQSVRNHGYVPPAEDLAKVKVGVSTRDSVIETIGAPSSSGVLNEGGFYYVATRMQKYGVRAPRIIDRELVAISFDRRGVVSGVERYGLEAGKAVPLERRITETGADNKTFLRQLLGNLTNFSAGSLVD